MSNTRSGPKRSTQAGRGLEDAAGRGDVLAEEHDRRVALELLGERVADGDAELERRSRRVLRRALGGRVGIGRRQGGLDGVARARAVVAASTAASSSSATPSASSRCARERERIALAASARAPPWAGRRRVGLGVAVVAVGAGTRAASGRRRARARVDRLARGGAHRPQVVAVDRSRPAWRRRRRGAAMSAPAVTCGHRRELAVEVVLADEDDRQALDRGHVQALVEVGLVGGAVAEEAPPPRGPGAGPRAPAPSAAAIEPPTIP